MIDRYKWTPHGMRPSDGEDNDCHLVSDIDPLLDEVRKELQSIVDDSESLDDVRYHADEALKKLGTPKL